MKALQNPVGMIHNLMTRIERKGEGAFVLFSTPLRDGPLKDNDLERRASMGGADYMYVLKELTG